MRKRVPEYLEPMFPQWNAWISCRVGGLCPRIAVMVAAQNWGRQVKMAPVCVAWRLSLFALFVFFLVCIIEESTSLLVYDRQMPFYIRVTTETFVNHILDQRSPFSSPLLSGIHAHLWRALVPLPRRRRRGKRGSMQARVKTCLALWPGKRLMDGTWPKLVKLVNARSIE